LARLDARRLDALLRDPCDVRFVLLYGDDPGLIRERSERLRATLGAAEDPFRAVELSRDAVLRDVGLLAAEASAWPLTGGRRWVRVREATDAVAGPVRAALAAGTSALVVIEAPGLTGRSSLRALLEDAPEAVAIPCWCERGEVLAASLAAMLGEAGVGSDPRALDWLAARLVADRDAVRREAEKLAAYAGPGGRVDEAAVLALAGEDSSLELEDALFAALAGDVARADRALDSALGEGVAPVQLLRAAQRHLQRLHLAASGVSPDALRPPVFFRHRAAFDRSLRLWGTERLERACDALVAAERRAKSGGSSRPIPDAAVARAAILGLAQQAAALSRRSAGE
jgi:DNA polymerase-3 subunit delta